MKAFSLTKLLQIALIAVVTSFYCVSSAFAAGFQTMTHTITVDVPHVLSITADTGNFTLTMANWLSGSESDTKTVTYTVEANDMGQADGAPAINVNLDFLYENIALKADVGSYTKTSGNTELAEAASGFATIGTSNVALANKANTTAGSNGKLLKGTLPITYKAVATADVSSGAQLHTLYVTLTTV